MKKDPNPVGRPFKEIDTGLLQRLAKIHCTMNEISEIMGVSVDTLTRNYADLIKEAKAHGNASIRRKQYKKAMSGDNTMLIWLGKQLLKQSDKIDATLTVNQFEGMKPEDLLTQARELVRVLEESVANPIQDQKALPDIPVEHVLLPEKSPE
jgi:hypothetical protein